MSHTRLVVLADVFPPRPGGSGRWLWEIYRRLAGDAAFDISVLAGPADGAPAFDAVAPMPIARLEGRFPSWGVVNPASARAYLHWTRRLRATVRHGEAPVVHCGKALQEGLVAFFAGAPYWCYAHGEELTLARTSRELTFWTTRVLRGARGIVANSHHTERLLIDLWRLSPDRIHVLHPGVDTDRFVPAPPDDAVRARLGWSNRRVILTVGALQKRKGQDTLIKALPAIRQAVPDVLYAIAGEGWERAYLEETAAAAGVSALVQFLGSPSDADLVHLYQQCDLFALPNRQIGWDFEGFGIVLLEAQACGRPVVAGRSGGTSEAMDPGRTGELVEPDDPDNAARACVGLLSDPARRAALGAEARAWVESRFTWPSLVDQAAVLFRAGPNR